jgi:hypothetical protein
MPLPGEPNVWLLQIDPAAVASGRVMLDINNPSTGIQVGGSSSGTGIDWGQAAFTQLMAQEGQWGSAPADWIVPNRTITIPLGLGMGAAGGGPNANTALASLAEKVGTLQREGGWLMRQRSGAAAMYADIVDAQLSDPDVWGETTGVEPGVVLTLTCLPDFYGDEIALDSIPCTGYCSSVLTSGGVQAVIAGDYPARCRLQYGPPSSPPQSAVLWGIRSRHYASGLGAALQYEAENLTLASGSSVVTLTGASNGQAVTNTVAAANTPTAIVNLQVSSLPYGLLTHIGTYRVMARVYLTASNTLFALQWETYPGDSTLTYNAGTQVTGAISTFYLVDLGIVRIDPVSSTTGTAAWAGTITAQVPAGGDIVYIDEVFLIPLDDGAGSASTRQNFLPAGADIFLNSDGAWVGSGPSGPSGPVPSVLGDLPRIPCSGIEQRPAQLFLKPLRALWHNTYAQDGLDPFTVTPYYRPTYLFRP